MIPLVIVGAGGFACETVELVRAINAVRPTYELLGYLDDNVELHGSTILGVEVIGSIDEVHSMPEVSAVVCLGSPRTPTLRRRVVERLDLGDDRWATLVHPSAVVSSSVRLGAGTVVHATSVFTADIEVGRHVEVMPGVILTHGDRIDDYATFGAGVRLAGAVTIGSCAYIGSGAMVREGLDIGVEALVGMGSVVTRSVPAGEVWAGVPASRLRDGVNPSPMAAVPTAPPHQRNPTTVEESSHDH
jgi:sugar O-acyltransferase (sialic acid O-acetyltransferase NeuD family)